MKISDEFASFGVWKGRERILFNQLAQAYTVVLFAEVYIA